MKKLFILFVLIFVLASCNAEKETNNNIQTTNVEKITEITDKKEEKLKIVTSIIPLASITNYVGGEYVEAISLVPV
jgi:ABC-type Zn uptake system ZnuABC Zn-binding protein ZnuA